MKDQLQENLAKALFPYVEGLPYEKEGKRLREATIVALTAIQRDHVIITKKTYDDTMAQMKSTMKRLLQ